MRSDVVLMGFAVYDKPGGQLEHSFGFDEDGIRSLSYHRDNEYRFLGFVNTGAYACAKRGVEEPYERLGGHLRFQGSKFEGINSGVRHTNTRRIQSNRGELVYPTIALIFRANTDNLVGIITFPDSYFSSFKDRFYQNLNFFLHPFDDRYSQLDPKFKNGCRPPSGSNIIMLDQATMDKECAYELEKRQREAASKQQK